MSLMITRYSCSQKDLINEQVILALTLLFEQCCITSYLRMRRTNPFSSFIVSLSIEESTQQLNFSLAGLWCLTSYVCLCVRSSLASCTPAMLSALSLRRRTAVSDLTHTQTHIHTLILAKEPHNNEWITPRATRTRETKTPELRGIKLHLSSPSFPVPPYTSPICTSFLPHTSWALLFFFPSRTKGALCYSPHLLQPILSSPFAFTCTLGALSLAACHPCCCWKPVISLL